jgi:hypothetical protein
MQSEAVLKFVTKLYKNTASEQILKPTKECVKNRNSLFQSYFLNNSLVSILALALQVVQVCATICNHLEQTTAGMVILVVLLQVDSKCVDIL